MGCRGRIRRFRPGQRLRNTTVSTAPPPSAPATVTLPPWRSASLRTRASPRPRLPCAGRSLVDQPSVRFDAYCSGATPGPLSRTRRTTVRPSARSPTSIRASPDPAAASVALSTRLPTTVTRPRGSTTRSGSSVPGASRSETPRSAATVALPTSRAASSGSCTFSVTCSAVARWTPTTSVTNSMASWSPAPADPAACAAGWRARGPGRSASISPVVESSSRPRRSSSVRSRRVTTAPPSSVSIRLASRTRPPWTASRSSPTTRPASTSAVLPPSSTSA
ncbi:hypothetical protein SMICM17S_08276 [Streptomyces microflavus]